MIKGHQYAAETTQYCHWKPWDLRTCQIEIQEAIDRLSVWSTECNLAHNPKKTQVVLLAKPEMSRAHGLDKLSIDLPANGRELERVVTFRPLGTQSLARKFQLER